MTARITSPTFVGRVHELKRLEAALQRAQEGSPTTVLLGGDAGVGKTRLVEEFTSRARAVGVRVMLGGCLELGEGALPYTAVIEALRGLVDDVGLPELRRLAGEGAREVRRLIPALHTAVDDDRLMEAPLGGASQVRLFEALLRLLGALASDRPLVVALEDLHWADPSTRDLVVFLAHNLRDAGVVLLTTYRTDELHRQHPLRPVLAQLIRGDHAERIDVSAFDREELALQLEGITGSRPDALLVDRVFDRSQGNAFFAEELLAAGVDGATELPETLREILLDTITALPDPVPHVLRVAAAAGREVHHELLARVAAIGERELNEALRGAVERGVLVPHPGEGTYTFRHALLAEAAYSTVLPGERGPLHAALAEALESNPHLATGAAAAELAHHWHAAQDQPRSLVASLEAARGAEAVYGIVEASTHVERVLELWPHVEDAEKRTGLDLSQVMHWAADLSYLAGKPERAVVLQERALGEHAAADPVRRALMSERLGRYRWIAGDSAGAEAAYAEAVRLTSAESPSAERAKVLASYGQSLMTAHRYEDAVVYCEEAIDIARAVGARAVEGHALNTLGVCLTVGRGEEAGLASLREARDIADELDAPDDLMRGYTNYSHALRVSGRFREAMALAMEGAERGRELGIERLYGAGLANNAAEAAFLIGEWEHAEELLRAAPSGSGEAGSGWAYLMRASLQCARGEIEAARDALDAARRYHVDTHVSTRLYFSNICAWLALREGAEDGVRELIDVRPPVDAPSDEDAIELRAIGLRVLADAGRSEDADLADTLLAEARALTAPYTGSKPLSTLWCALAVAEHARFAGSPAPTASWREALAVCEQLGVVHQAAYARFRLAKAMLDAGERDEVEDLLMQAFEAADRLGARPLRDDIVELARRARIDLHAEDPATPAERYGLTAREAEVLGLVAEGRTNREIGEALYISEKTASVHVSNILRKLQAANRAEAAAVAHRLGMTAEGSAVATVRHRSPAVVPPRG